MLMVWFVAMSTATLATLAIVGGGMAKTAVILTRIPAGMACTLMPVCILVSDARSLSFSANPTIFVSQSLRKVSFR
jgi:hypothetical protein